MITISYSHKRQLILETALVSGFTFLMVLSAYVRIPLFFTPVPITMQTFVVYLSILFLKNKSFFSQGLYLFLGLAGLPVFTNFGSGFLYLLGPTGGYIVGFILAAAVFSRFLPRSESFLKNFIFFLLPAAAIYTLGVLWLIAFHKFSLSLAVAGGLLPFLAGEILKISLASLIAMRVASSK